jgi:hypothetical protein
MLMDDWLACRPEALDVRLLVTPADCHWSQFSPRVKNPPEIGLQRLVVFHSLLSQTQSHLYFVHFGPRSEALYNELAFSEVVVGSSKVYADHR